MELRETEGRKPRLAAEVEREEGRSHLEKFLSRTLQ